MHHVVLDGWSVIGLIFEKNEKLDITAKPNSPALNSFLWPAIILYFQPHS